MKVIVYEPTYNDRHCEIVRDFAAGIPDAVVKKALEFEPDEADIGVIFGWYKTAYELTMSKKPIIEHYLSKGPGRLLIVESGFQRRGLYYQIAWNKFAGHGDFKSDNSPDDRWKSFNIKLKPWRNNHRGNCVVIGQLERDTQVQDVDHIAWCQKTVNECLQIYGNVSFRPHPRCKNKEVNDYNIPSRLLDTGSLEDTLAGARCIVTWNSTTGVDAVIAGVPVIAMERGSMAWPLASHTLDESLRRPQRSQWLAALGYSQWTRREMRAGLPWRHLTG